MIRRMFLIATAAVVILGWPFLIENRYFAHIGVLVCISATLALSVNMMLRIGQLSAAHGAFMGLGAYGSALMVGRLGFPFVLAFPLSALLVGVAAAALGPILLRIKGVYFVLLTFALGEVVNLAFQQWVDLFGGNNGLFGIAKVNLFGLILSTPRDNYLFGVALVAATLAVSFGIFRSTLGAVLDSLHENEVLSSSLGSNALSFRVCLFAISAFFAALSGGLYAHYTGFLSPEAFGLTTFVDVLVINMIGGVSSPFGPVLGAVLIVPLPELLRDARQYQMLSYGLLLIVCVLFLPSGIVGAIRGFDQRWRR